MADRKDEQDDSDFQERDNEASATDAYGIEVSRFEAMADRDLNDALHRYGFSMFHSLPGLKQIELGRKLGFQPKSAADHFNLASLAISKEDYKGAANQLQKALELDPQLSDALYNLAMCQEKLNHKQDAVKLWNRYLEAADSDEEKAQVREHLAQLSA